MQEDVQNGNFNTNYQESEISLFEIWSIIVKRKMLIFSVFVLSILISLSYLLFAKPTYESFSILRVGQVGQILQDKQYGYVSMIEEPYIVVKRLTEKYKIDDISEGEIELPKLTSISISKNNSVDTPLLKLTAQGRSAAEARDFLTKVVEELSKEHDLLFNSILSKRTANLTSMKGELQKIDSKIDLYDRQIINFKGRDDSLIALLVQQKLGLEKQRASLEREITDLEVYLDKPFTLSTIILRQPTLPVGAVNKRFVSFLGIAGILGIMLGIFLVIFLDYWERQKEQLRQVKVDNKVLPFN